MTREEAIHILNNLKPTNTNSSFDAYIIGKALTMAISALYVEPCDDCISRSNVLNKIKEVCFSKEWRDFRIALGDKGQTDFIIKYIENMPSVQSIRPKGEWSGHMYDTCSCCGAELHDIYIISDATDCSNVALFCPHCGADMRGDK